MTYQSVSFANAAPAAQACKGLAPQTPGMLVRRPDLSDEAVMDTIAQRLRFEGRDPAQAPGVLKAAMEGRHAAKAFLRKLVLPAPQSSLQMPIQSILREKAQREGSTSWFRRVSFGR